MAPNRTPKAITEADSVKARSNALSFLDLSPELRNQIYSTFFTPSKDIRICRLSGRVKFEDDRIRRNFLHGMPLLSVCRQVYHEAATMFFSSNTWTIYGEECRSRCRFAVPIQDGARFMSLLGSRFSMLKQLVIDLRDTCSPTCTFERKFCYDYRDPYLDLLGAVHIQELVKQLHHSPDMGLHVEVVFTPAPQTTQCPPSALAHTDLQLSRLSNLLRTLVKDPLGFQKYGSQIYEILIARDATAGCVMFGNSMDTWSHKQHFHISDSGDSISPIPPSSPDTIMRLPPTVKSQIFQLVAFGPRINGQLNNTATFDLDSRTCTEVSTVLGSVCKELRSKYLSQFWSTNNSTTKMMSTDTRTDFDGFRKLERFWCDSGSARYPWRLEKPILSREFELLLWFKAEPVTDPQSIRVNVTDLLRITSSVRSDTGKLSISVVRGNKKTPSITSISFDELRWYALVALTEFLRQYPDAQRKLCPKVWINGLGQVIEVESTETTMDLKGVIQRYTPWVKHRRTLVQDYGIELDADEDKSGWYWYKKYAPAGPSEAFDGSLHFYIGYLRRCGLDKQARYWSDCYFQYPDA